MKKLLTYITAAALIFSLGACSEEDGSLYDFTLDPSVEATFASDELSFGGLTADFGGKVSVPMYRGNTAEAASVPVTITGGEGTFTPSKSSFDFAAGENVAYIDFAFDFETMSPAPVTISIVANNEEDISDSDNAHGATEVILQKQLTYSSLVSVIMKAFTAATGSRRYRRQRKVTTSLFPAHGFQEPISHSTSMGRPLTGIHLLPVM